MKIPEPAIEHLLTELAGGQVFAKRAPDKAIPPYVIFNRSDSSRWRHINGPSGKAQAYIQIDSYAEGYYAAKGLSMKVEAILDGYRGTVTHAAVVIDEDTTQTEVRIAGISLQNDVDLLDETDEPVLDRVSQLFLVTYYQS